MVTSEGYELQGVGAIPSDALNLTISGQGEVTYGLPGSTTLSSAGTITMSTFINPAGLQAMGGNVFIETPASGAPVTGTPGDAGIGGTIQGALETSNVNSVEELVDMITVQRAFEMNSKVISTADQMLSFVTQQL